MKFRKSPHWTEKSLRHAQKPATPRSANPCGPESTSVTPGKDPPMATPPQGRKMAPERPFPSLLRLAKVTQKRGFCRQFSGGFPTVLPVVSPGGFPAVSRRFSRQVRRRFSSGFPPFSGGSTAVFRQFSSRFPAAQQRFSGKFDGGWTTVFRQHASPGSTPIRLRPLPSSERNCRAIPYTLSSLQTQHMGRGKFPPVHGVPGRSAAGRNPTPLVEVLGDRIAVQDASGGISPGTSPTGHSGQRDADFA